MQNLYFNPFSQCGCKGINLNMPGSNPSQPNPSLCGNSVFDLSMSGGGNAFASAGASASAGGDCIDSLMQLAGCGCANAEANACANSGGGSSGASANAEAKSFMEGLGLPKGSEFSMELGDGSQANAKAQADAKAQGGCCQPQAGAEAQAEAQAEANAQGGCSQSQAAAEAYAEAEASLELEVTPQQQVSPDSKEKPKQVSPDSKEPQKETKADPKMKGEWGDPHYHLIGADGKKIDFDHHGTDGNTYNVFQGDNISVDGLYVPANNPKEPQVIGNARLQVGENTELMYDKYGKASLNGQALQQGTNQVLEDGTKLTYDEKGQLSLVDPNDNSQLDLRAEKNGITVDPSGSFSGMGGIIGTSIAESRPLSNEEANGFDVTAERGIQYDPNAYAEKGPGTSEGKDKGAGAEKGAEAGKAAKEEGSKKAKSKK